MEWTTRVDPHILRRVLDTDREMVATIPVTDEADPDAAPVERRALLVFPSVEDAADMAPHVGAGDCEATPVTPEDVGTVCANHGLALVAFWPEGEPFGLSIFSVETFPLILMEES